MNNEWTINYDWQSGHNPENMKYEIYGKISPPINIYPELYDCISMVPGVTVDLNSSLIKIAAWGQDAIGSISEASTVFADELAKTNPHVVIKWHEQAPVSTIDHLPAEYLDGYWIPAQNIDDYRRRRELIIAVIREATIDKMDSVSLEMIDGKLALVGRKSGMEEFCLWLGQMQIDLIEEAQREGKIHEFVDSLFN